MLRSVAVLVLVSGCGVVESHGCPGACEESELEMLLRAPEWARRRLFAHASPSVELVGLDGRSIDARSMIGRRHLVVYWDRADRVEEAAAVTFMQVLQKAQADLLAAGVQVVFAHVRFPDGHRAPMSIDELRAWTDRWALALPPVPTFRLASTPERAAKQDLRVLENLGGSPTIVLLDERGLVRWHSEGVQTPPPHAAVQNPEQYTIIEAVAFALEQL